MRLALFSDLHLEQPHWGCWQPPELDVDLVLLAGDIGSLAGGLEWAASSFQRRSVAYVVGNHEYYHSRLMPLAALRRKYARKGVHLLERNTFEMPGLRVLGCTLWSGFDLLGKDKITASMLAALLSINDYRLIGTKSGKRLFPQDTLDLHRRSVSWLDRELAKPFDGKTVVLTHFAPHRNCAEPRFEKSALSPYFVTDLAWLMDKHRIDFYSGNGCRVISNQRGYQHERTEGFQPDCVIEL
ncbi:MAG: hypothetical protein A2286_10495 [Gammaproteobacteria bacterium RIFOXYA12_FULL_61_12]|nr:MAG: hypothetical protein A2286_10495 [Gammaproteobacteria bacterium RIFOXYA12_FULL_61_12]